MNSNTITVSTLNGKTAACICTVSSPSGSTGVAAFVTRLYENFLDCVPRADEVKSWSDVLESGDITGAKVVRGFVFSDEYQRRMPDNRSYVTTLYRVILNREPDSSGLNSWITILENGCTKHLVL